MSITVDAATTMWTEDMAYAALRRLIMDAELLPNTHHLESIIASDLGVDLAALHAAIMRLEREGLVQSEGRGGFWISPIATKETLDIMGKLAALESRAAYIAASTGPATIDIYTLHDAIAAMQDALYRNDEVRYARAEHHFHRSIVQSSDDSPLISAALAYSEPMHRIRMLTLRLEPLPQDSLQDYMLLVDALRAGEASRAYHLHRAHWRRMCETTCKLLRKNHMECVTA